jgi:hypothetical protein
MQITIVDEKDVPVDFTGATVARLVVSLKEETAPASLTLNKSLTFGTPRTSGQLLATWTSAETAAVIPGRYEGQIEVVLSDGNTGIWGTIDFIVLAPRKKQA